MENIDQYMQHLTNFAIQYGPKVLGALVVLILGMWIIKQVVKALKRALKSKAVEPTLETFLGSLASWILYILLFISVGSMLGIATTSFVALLGAGGLAVGLALQGSLSNFAGGVLILFFKPFKVGDRIETMSRTGQVTDIKIFHTTLITLDKKNHHSSQRPHHERRYC